MRKLIGMLACLALLVGALAGASIAAAEEPPAEAGPAVGSESAGPFAPLEESCFANKVCIYAGPGFNNMEGTVECSSSGLFTGAVATAAKNKCGNKTVYLRWNGSNIRCLDPGEQAGEPGAFDEFFITAEYGAFC
jgi:hypothetical protein